MVGGLGWGVCVGCGLGITLWIGGGVLGRGLGLRLEFGVVCWGLWLVLGVGSEVGVVAGGGVGSWGSESGGCKWVLWFGVVWLGGGWLWGWVGVVGGGVEERGLWDWRSGLMWGCSCSWGCVGWGCGLEVGFGVWGWGPEL